MSIDPNGMARVEKLSFDAYNENETLQLAVEHYKERTGLYPEKILVDTIYRNRKNLAYCKEHGIKISGPALGRPKKNVTAEEKHQSYTDAVDRIEVERRFSLAKRCFGLGLITTKLDETTRGSIVLSIIAMNLDRLMSLFTVFILKSIFNVQWQIKMAYLPVNI